MVCASADHTKGCAGTKQGPPYLLGEFGSEGADEVGGGAAARVLVGALGVAPHVLHPVQLEHLLQVLAQPDVGDHYRLAHLHSSHHVSIRAQSMQESRSSL